MSLFYKNFKASDIQDLIAKSDFVQKYCVNDFRPDGFCNHTLPLKNTSKFQFDKNNWDLPQDIREAIARYLQALDKYADTICSLIMSNKLLNYKQVLPPWIVFPSVSSFSAFWRMGKGEGYLLVFRIFFDSLSTEEKNIYKSLYPEPEYFKRPLAPFYPKEDPKILNERDLKTWDSH